MSIQKGIKYLIKADPILRDLIKSTKDKPDIKKNPKPFQALCRSIIYQQLAGKAAATIHGRFVSLYPRKNPTPDLILTTNKNKLKKCGLSGQKIEYLKDLSRKCLDGTVKINKLNKLPDQEIIDELVKVKGIGEWTAQMFLMFNLGRLDVFAPGDLAIQNVMRKLYRLSDQWKKEHLEEIAEKWKPYRTIACWYLWHYKDGGNWLRKL